MMLIADSGSTKTHWCLLEKSGEIKHIFTNGINPYYQSEVEITCDIEMNLLPELKDTVVNHIYFYGAGCSFPEKKALVIDALGNNFRDVTIKVESDLLGAARSLFAGSKGVACILGTGSNSCLYDGRSIIENVSPLGFILGDEGSGAVLGKTLIADCLKNQLTPKLKNKLLTEYKLTPAIILNKVYKQAFPNRFLAGLTPFLLEHIDEPSIFNLVYDSFDAFFVRNVMQYPLKDIKVGFVGSIAFYFRDTLEIVASKRGIGISEIVQSPMEGLIAYHRRLPATEGE